jgi:GNAT superfamily N-acetyltransferase
MIIRGARKEDFDAVWSIGKSFYRYASLESHGLYKDEAEFKNYFDFLIGNENTVLFVVSDGDKIIGTIAGIFHPWFMDGRQKIVSEQWLWIEPEFRGKGYDAELLSVLSAWGLSRGAKHLIMVAIGGEKEESLKKYYKRKGYQYLETHFIKGI